MFTITPITSPKQLDCGATCLKMLLSYYGIEEDLDTLITACNTKLTGCSGADILRAGRAYGLDMRAYRMDSAELIVQDRPAIIWWKYNHWCIFAGLDENRKVVLLNPDLGKYRLSADTFASFYSGIALFNGEPADMDIPASSYEQRIIALEDELVAAKIMLGVDN